MEGIYKKEGKLNIYEYHRGIILPQKADEKESQWGLGGVCNEDNQFVEESIYDGGWAKHGGYYPWKQEEYRDEEIVYIGLFLKHWGHFLVDVTGRMWALKQILAKKPNIKIAYVGSESMKGNYLHFLELLGVDEKQLMQVKTPTRFQKIFLPQISFRPCIWFTDEFRQMYDDIITISMKKVDKVSEFEISDKVYFTRRQFSKAQQSEFGEELIEETFLLNGYKPIAPEKLSLEEQIYVWNKASEIVCLNGTIPLNVVFCKNDKLKLLILNKMSFEHKNPYIFLKMRNIKAIFLNVYKEPLKNYPKSLGEGPYLLYATEEFIGYCKKNKLELPLSGNRLKKYQMKQKVKYYLSVLAIKQRIRLLISKIVPDKLKEIIRWKRGKR